MWGSWQLLTEKRIEGDLLCTSTNFCPPDQPFCINNGCVFECPESSYINGTNCVAECGDLFVLNNRTCVEHCPTKSRIRETPKLIGREFYMEKLCVKSCNSEEYLYDTKCLHVCPMTHTHVNGRNCSRSCTEDRPFIKNFTVNEITFHDCVQECDHLTEDGYCTEQCSGNKSVLNSVCISSCPSEYPFISGRNCVQYCPDSTILIEYNTCLSKCPLNRSYSYNNSCTNQCPGDFYKILENGMWHCIKECPENMFIDNQTCVWHCPDRSFINNRTCGSECLTDLPFACEVQDEQKCGTADGGFISTYPPIKHTLCVEYCPQNTYVLDSTCVPVCPLNYKYFNKSCVKNCPKQFSYVYNKTFTTGCNDYFGGCDKVTIEPTCSKECPNNTYSYNKTCHYACPVGLYTVDRKCVPVCPEAKYLKQNKVVSITSYYRKNPYSFTYKWRKTNTKSNITECVADCGDDMVIFNLTCSEKCLENMTYVTNRTCHKTKCETKYMKNKPFYVQCTDVCKDDYFVYNSTCIDNCPEDTFVVNRTCASECSSDLPFTLNRTFSIKCSITGTCDSIKKYTECARECPSETYTLNDTCYEVCPSLTFVLENKCVHYCPESHPYHQETTVTFAEWHKQWRGWSKTNKTVKRTLCVRVCPPGKLVYNQTCLDKCPKGTYYVDNVVCVQDCPKEKPLKFTGNDTWMCIHDCGDDRMFNNGDCTYYCTNPSFAFEGKCIKECPEGYFWWYYTCVHRIEAITECIILFGVDCIILAFGKRIIKEYFIVIWTSFGCSCNNEELDEQPVNIKQGDVIELKRIDIEETNSGNTVGRDKYADEDVPLISLELLVDEETL